VYSCDSFANPLAEASQFFISSLSEWASEFRKLEPSFTRFSIVGHSLGGYLGTLFALKYPQSVDRLMLVSPVGIPARPVDFKGPQRALHQRVLLGMMKMLWDRNMSPQSLARYEFSIWPRLSHQQPLLKVASAAPCSRTRSVSGGNFWSS